MTDLLRRYGRGLTAVFILLTAFWLLLLVVLPNLYLFENSFRPYLPMADIGGPKDVYSLSNYLTFFKSPIHISVFFWTIIYSSLVTVICFMIAYPMAFYLSKIAQPKMLPTIFLLLFIPLWVSEILRAFAWFIILALKGPLNASLIGLGIIEDPIRWMTGFRSGDDRAGLYLRPLHAAAALQRDPVAGHEPDRGIRRSGGAVVEDASAGDPAACEAGNRVGGGDGVHAVGGSILVPTLLASTSSRWFTEIIQQWMFESQDWNTGSAYAFLLLILCTVFVSVVMRVFRVKLSDIAK